MNHQSMHLLLVEDNPGDLGLLRRLLSQAPSVHFSWEHVEQLSVAIDILRSQHFDLVLLDLSLPDSQPPDTFGRLYPHALCLPIVIMTDSNDEPLAIQAMQAGAQDYFIKGKTNIELLLQALRQAKERKRAETELRMKVRELTMIAEQLDQVVRIGHDLNNSLATVMLSIEALLTQIPAEDLKHADLRVVHDEVIRMGRLVSNLLQFNHGSLPQISEAGVKEDLASIPGLIQYIHENNIVPVQEEFTYFFQASQAETAGYLLKGNVANELVASMHRAFQEGVRIPRTLGPRLLYKNQRKVQAMDVSSYQRLSPREREVLQLIARGCTNKDVAKRLSISVRTVERLRSSITSQLGVRNRAELVIYAVQQNLLD